MMQFQGLSEDNIRSIFSFCDISTVLAVGMANKYLHRLSVDKLVWVDLVDNLRRRGFIDLLSLSDIRSKSQEELVGLVKALLTGPASWNAAPAKSKLPFLARFRSKRTSQPWQAHGQAEISTEYILHPSSMDPSRMAEVKLLPGGKYILIRIRETLECWSMQGKKLIWVYENSSPDSSATTTYIIGFSAEVLDGGDEANIIVCEGLTFNAGAKSVVHILNLNFHTGISTTLFTNSYPFVCHQEPKICGNIACLVWIADNPSSLPKRCCTCILIDWQSMLHLQLADDLWHAREPPTLAYPIRDHVILFAPISSEALKIHLFNITAFSRHWRPITDASQSFPVVNISEVQSIISEPVTQFRDTWKPEFCVFESPLEKGTYRICVYGWRPSSSVLLACSYHLSLPNGTRDAIFWRQRYSQTANFKYFGRVGIPYSGHILGCFRSNNHPGIFHPQADSSQGIEVPQSDSRRAFSHTSTYSGAMIYRERDAVVVTYFK
ncbi:F-box domain-containing protein [Mycena venus]|uniref:F-box domain-containing protein n=1 Tax=Mycena venus TaxID=2733690 RepID=A0A8H7D7Y0_9AGAR|nr:F-box domain-containing protein [Mycena venus]